MISIVAFKIHNLWPIETRGTAQQYEDEPSEILQDLPSKVTTTALPLPKISQWLLESLRAQLFSPIVSRSD
jgi:hypothetical protein